MALTLKDLTPGKINAINAMLEQTWGTIIADVKEASRYGGDRLTITAAADILIDADLCRLHGMDAHSADLFDCLSPAVCRTLARNVVRHTL
jgi:hypothetical protein